MFYTMRFSIYLFLVYFQSGNFDVFNFDNSDFHPPSPPLNYHTNSINQDWMDIVLPAYPFVKAFLQGRSYLILGLEPDQQYEAKVQAK